MGTSEVMTSGCELVLRSLLERISLWRSLSWDICWLIEDRRRFTIPKNIECRRCTLCGINADLASRVRIFIAGSGVKLLFMVETIWIARRRIG